MFVCFCLSKLVCLLFYIQRNCKEVLNFKNAVAKKNYNCTIVIVINCNAQLSRRRDTSVNSPHINWAGGFAFNTVSGGHHPLWSHQGATAVAEPRARPQLSLPGPVSMFSGRASNDPRTGTSSTRAWWRQSAVRRCSPRSFFLGWFCAKGWVIIIIIIVVVVVVVFISDHLIVLSLLDSFTLVKYE